MGARVRFPRGFLWGAATAGHQVEGGNVNSDCWAVEHVEPRIFRDPSGDAVDFYHRYPEDIVTMADLGMTAFRFSLEWSRIEPEPGFFSQAELGHYHRLAQRCHEAGLATVVTLNHWTTPRWFAAEGGWENPASIDRFARFAEVTSRNLGEEMDWVITLNEPNVAAVVALGGAVARPSGNRAAALAEATARYPGGAIGFRPMMMWSGDQLARYRAAHEKARAAIKSVLDRPVGWSLACEDYQAVPGGEAMRDSIRQGALTDWLEVSQQDDFVGVQNYTSRLIDENGLLPVPAGIPVNDLGWGLYPGSLTNAASYAAEVSGRPVLVTEHGLASDDDALRLSHTRASLVSLGEAIGTGLDVRGYLHWTLLDEFEWWAGYSVTFGLIEVDRSDFRRTPRESAHWLGRVARANDPDID